MWLVGFSKQSFKLVTEFGLRQRFKQIVRRLSNGFVECYAPNRQAVLVYVERNFDPIESTIPVDELRRRYFFEVMVFSGNPENRNGFHAPLRQTFAEFHGRKCFVNRVKRSAEKSSLLAGNYREAISFAQQVDVGKSLLTCSPITIYPLERITQFATICLLREQNSFRTGRKIEVVANYFGIETSQCNRIAQIVQKQSSLLRNSFERERFDPQSGFLRRAVTGSLGGVQ